MNHEHPIKDELCRWIAAHSAVFSEDAVPSNMAIIEKRIITSVQLMDLILYLEHLKGEPINPAQIKPGAFASVDSIYQHFFCEAVSRA
ncbi:MAG: hypothetical protein H6937_06220 [Burkholderiales bacterium]|nr:hypothetical protein [Burkholderiales bacterium]MDR4517396.1 hypothetical protein [Nitrosomonas sp.]